MRLTLPGKGTSINCPRLFLYVEIPKSDASLNREIRKPMINSSTYLIVEWLLRDVCVEEIS